MNEAGLGIPVFDQGPAPEQPDDTSGATGGPAEREHYIPLRKADLVELLAHRSNLSADSSRDFLQLCRLLEATFHYEYHQRLESLKNAYAPFDPDSDTRALDPLETRDLDKTAGDLFAKFAELLQRANFRRLSDDEIKAAVGTASEWGVRLHVDFSIFDRLEVYVRGDAIDRRTRRRPSNLYRPEEVEVPIHRRLVVAFRLRNQLRLNKNLADGSVYIKIFKNVPKNDVDMLLPGTRIRMTLMDQGKIILPTLSGIALTVFKIVKGALVLAFASVYGMFAFLGLVAGTIGYGVKSFFGYLQTRDKYQLNLTRSLYYQNLDNNAGVLFRLLDAAEEQEFREAVLAYFLLWQQGGEEGWNAARIDREAELPPHDALDIDVDFEIEDSLAKLTRLGLVQHLAGERYRATPIRAALAGMDRVWDGYFQCRGPDSPTSAESPIGLGDSPPAQ